MLTTREGSKSHIIVIGNEKGGCGKTTTSVHLVAALLDLGFRVGTVDLDSRQKSLSRYFENRRQYIFKQGVRLPIPQHMVIARSPFNHLDDAEEDERNRLTEALTQLALDNDFIIVDCPGSDQYMSRLVHSLADTVITPINDSFIDMDVLAQVNPETFEIVKPSIYSEMLWEQKLMKAKNQGGGVDWIVMRNRLSNLDAKNKRRVMDVLDRLSRRIGFRLAPGFSERVIFRELFLQGLTVIDVVRAESGVSLNLSHIAAREEVRELLRSLKIERVNEALRKQLEEDMNKKGNMAYQSSASLQQTAETVEAAVEDTNVSTKISPARFSSVSGAA